MATIQVYKYNTDTLLGTGTGTVDKKQQTAAVDAWTSKPGLVVNTKYKLKADGVTYTDTNCTAINPAPPLATFNNVA